MKNKISLFLFSLFSVLIFLTPVSQAQVSCAEVHSAQTLEQNKWTLNSVEQLIQAHKKEIPAFYKIVGDKKIPVMLLNRTSMKPLSELIEDTMSHTVMLMYDKENPNHTDHGIFRVGKFMADLDSPGVRGYGEINDNGLSWKQVRPYFDRRVRDEDNGVTNNFDRFEIVFKISPQQKQEILFYQMARRATVFRVPWTFHGADQVQQGKQNLLGNNCGEHCYIFSTGSGVRAQISAIRQEIQNMGIADVDRLMGLPEIQEFIGQAREKLLSTAYNAEEMKWDIVNGDQALVLTQDVLPKEMESAKRKILLNWIVALKASQGYDQVQRSLGLNGGWGLAEIKNPNVIGVIFWAPGSNAKAFDDATFSSRGVQTNWTADNQVPF